MNEPAPYPLLQGRCPRCKIGRVFHGVVSMHEFCPHCGLRFGREPGYFLGAMYFSYALGVLVLGLLLLLAWWLLPASWELHELLLVALLGMAPLTPAIFRYSRLLWMYWDQTFDPR
jgi:uncharacterized protein (DUF983 family)